MQLINTTTNQPLKTGDIVCDFRGKRWIFEGGREPHKPSSTGFVWFQPVAPALRVLLGAISHRK